MNHNQKQETTTAAPMSLDALDSAIQDIGGMVSSAKHLLVSEISECPPGAAKILDASIYILERADQRLTDEIISGAMAGAAGSDTMPALEIDKCRTFHSTSRPVS